MIFENYKIVLYRHEDGSRVVEIPALSGCCALMPTREQAFEELNGVFQMVSEEIREKGLALPADGPAAEQLAERVPFVVN